MGGLESKVCPRAGPTRHSARRSSHPKTDPSLSQQGTRLFEFEEGCRVEASINRIGFWGAPYYIYSTIDPQILF